MLYLAPAVSIKLHIICVIFKCRIIECKKVRSSKEERLKQGRDIPIISCFHVLGFTTPVSGEILMKKVYLWFWHYFNPPPASIKILELNQLSFIFYFRPNKNWNYENETLCLQKEKVRQDFCVYDKVRNESFKKEKRKTVWYDLWLKPSITL